MLYTFGSMTHGLSDPAKPRRLPTHTRAGRAAGRAADWWHWQPAHVARTKKAPRKTRSANLSDWQTLGIDVQNFKKSPICVTILNPDFELLKATLTFPRRLQNHVDKLSNMKSEQNTHICVFNKTMSIFTESATGTWTPGHLDGLDMTCARPNMNNWP